MKNLIWIVLLLVFFAFSLFYLHSRLGAELNRRELLSFYTNGLSFRMYNNHSFSCMQFPKDLSLYPKCYEKMIWMFSGWKTHKCYAEYGIDGSLCSFRRYLSVVENHCPPLPSESVSYKLVETDTIAKTSTDLQMLLDTLGHMKFSYMKDRLTQYWSSWSEALQRTFSRYSHSMKNRKKMNVMLHMGILADPNINFGQRSSSGGPLGELLQWTDLIACLFLLGHNLYISTDKATLLQHVDLFPVGSPCPNDRQGVDLIITDIVGLRSFNSRKDFIMQHKCRIRLLDSFGTHVEFNYKSYFNAHQGDLGMKGKSRNPWGGNELKLLQYWTFFPHTPDNDFLGFAIHKSNTKPMFERNSRGRPVSLIYGKEKYMWSGSEAVINILKNLTEVHATVADAKDSSGMFSNVINHGFLNGSAVAALMKSSNIFFGLGFPLEGPAPLEAIAHGAVFINPKFIPPKSRRNTMFLHEKPTLREFTSQSPYLERFGKPHVYTVDFSNTSALENALMQAIKEKPDPFVPEEYTPEGMLIRVHVLISRDLCSNTSVWPPIHAFLPKLGVPDISCEDVCHGSNFVCEPSFFSLINSATLMESKMTGSLNDVPTAMILCFHARKSIKVADLRWFSVVHWNSEVSLAKACPKSSPPQAVAHAISLILGRWWILLLILVYSFLGFLIETPVLSAWETLLEDESHHCTLQPEHAGRLLSHDESHRGLLTFPVG